MRAGPDSILYDPENDGTLLASLGTHEHWNDSLHKQYSRNLGTGNGIELLALTPVTAVDREAAAAGRPTAAALLQNYPNPCYPTTSITFQLADRDDVRLEVYDLLGRPVATLLRGTLERGMYTVPFDGSLLPSGMYLYRLEAGQISATKTHPAQVACRDADLNTVPPEEVP